MQTATITKGNKVARIKQTSLDIYRVVVTQVSDISEYGDVLIARSFKTAKGAVNFANKELI